MAAIIRAFNSLQGCFNDKATKTDRFAVWNANRDCGSVPCRQRSSQASATPNMRMPLCHGKGGASRRSGVCRALVITGKGTEAALPRLIWLTSANLTFRVMVSATIPLASRYPQTFRDERPEFDAGPADRIEVICERVFGPNRLADPVRFDRRSPTVRVPLEPFLAAG